MDPAKISSTGADHAWIQAARENAMEGSTVAAKGDCLAAMGAGIISASGAMVRGVWHSLMGKVREKQVANEDTNRALEVLGRAILGLLDADSLKTAQDHKNISVMEALAPEIKAVLGNQSMSEDTKKTLDSWYRTAQTIVKKGSAKDAATVLQKLQNTVNLLKSGNTEALDVKDVQRQWQEEAATKRMKVKPMSDPELDSIAKALISRHPLVVSSPEAGMHGRAVIVGQNPNVPRPGNPLNPPKPE